MLLTDLLYAPVCFLYIDTIHVIELYGETLSQLGGQLVRTTGGDTSSKHAQLLRMGTK